MELEHLVTNWQELREKRRQLETQAEKIKDAETKYEDEIKTWLDGQGMTGAKLPIGTVGRKVLWSARLSDAEAFANLQYQTMKDIALQNESHTGPARSMLDGLLMQKRPLKEGVETIAKQMCESRGLEPSSENIAAVAKEFGIDYVPTVSLTFTKK